MYEILIKDLADNFGSQCVVLAIDTKFMNGDWYVFLNGGRIPTELKALISDASKVSGRSINAEAQYRLEKSFEGQAN